MRTAAELIGEELTRMTAVLRLEGASNVPEQIIAKKYFRLRLSNGHIAGTLSSPEEAGDRRRDHLVRVSPFLQQSARQGTEEVRVPVNVYGAVYHYVLAMIDDAPMAITYIECIKSSADIHGASGLAQRRRNTECFTSPGGAMRHVNVLSIDAVVGSLFVRGRHVVLYTRDVLSTGEIPGFSTPPPPFDPLFPGCRRMTGDVWKREKMTSEGKG